MMELLSKYHNLWVSMGLSMGIPQHLVEDIVQEMYLRLNKYVKNPEKITLQEFLQNLKIGKMIRI